MAKLNNQVIGRLSGKIGNIVFRQRNGKNFASSRPGSFFPGFDEASVGRRDKFGAACKFSSKLYSIPYLKKIWKDYLPSGKSPYNYITKINYKCAEPGKLTDYAVIVPDSGFKITVSSSTLSQSSMTVIIDKVESNSCIDPVREPVLRLCVIMCFTNPIEEKVDRIEFIALVSEEQATVLNTPITFKIGFSDKEINLFNNYRDKKIFSAIISVDVNDNPVHYSKTFLL